jgi:GntR family transcriptional regulator
LVVNPNTVAKVYRELEHEGVIELRHGAGAFVAAGRGAEPEERAERLRRGQGVVRGAVSKLDALGLSEEEVRRLFEAELTRLREGGGEAGAAAAARRKP